MVEPVNDNILNLVNELYNNLDAKDKIINEQALEISRLNKIIDDVDEFCDRYMGCNLELFDMYGLLNKIRKILGDKENETN